jgi:hypothetical protein
VASATMEEVREAIWSLVSWLLSLTLPTTSSSQYNREERHIDGLCLGKGDMGEK